MNIVERRETDMERCLRPGHAGVVASLLVALAFLGWSADEALVRRDHDCRKRSGTSHGRTADARI